MAKSCEAPNRKGRVALALCLVWSATPLFPVASAVGASAEVSPPEAGAALSDEQKERFLLEAEIAESRIIETGVTAPRRATLSDGWLTHDAHVQSIDLFRKRMELPSRTHFNFRDSYKYNIAAYRLDRLLDLGMVPVSVQRVVLGKPSAVSWWIDGVVMSDLERREKGVSPPDLALWNDQMHQARVFTQLVYNIDPNMGNLLIAEEWRLWLVDFTRSFRLYKELPEPELLVRIDRRVLRGLRRLALADLERATRPSLTRPEMKAVLARRDLMLEIFDRRIATEGEAAVVCDLPGH